MSKSQGHSRALISAARRLDPQALATLLESYRNYLRLLARTGIDASLRGKADPSDLVQETLLKASQNIASFRGQTEAELAGWLRQILSQNLVDLVRRRGGLRGALREQSLNDLLDRSSIALEAVVARQSGSLAAVAEFPFGRDPGVLLAEAMSELPPDYREVITLRNLEHLDWQQVGKRLGRTPDAARMLWVRALKHLRPLIETRL
jgi:RNA polymerase sigma-70 factor (ECF subfamily)